MNLTIQAIREKIRDAVREGMSSHDVVQVHHWMEVADEFERDPIAFALAVL